MGIGITPTALVERFAQDGIRISERELRRRARELGCCHQIGNAMFFTPDDIDRLIAGLATSPSAQLGSAPAPEIPEGAGLAEALALQERLMREQAEASRKESARGRRPRRGGD
jgi:hypothetical protein